MIEDIIDSGQKASLRGKWWVPGTQSSKRLDGALKIEAPERITLELDKYDQIIFPKDLGKVPRYERENYEILLGKLNSGDSVTLVNCEYQHASRNTSGTAVEKYLVSTVFLGAHLQANSQREFDEITVTFNDLGLFLDITGFGRDGLSWDKKGDVFAHYSKPKSLTLLNINRLRIELDFWGKWSSLGTSMRIEEKYSILFKYSEKVSFKLFLTDLKKLQDFLLFVSQRIVYPESIRVISGKQGNFPIRVFSIASYPRTNTAVFGASLLEISRVQDSIQTLLKNWFEHYDRAPLVLPSYLANYYAPRGYLEHNFLNLMQALEGFHRVHFKDTYVDPSEYSLIYSHMIKQIPPEVDEDHRESLSSKLRYGNEYSLRKRIKEIICYLENDKIDLSSFNTDWKPFIESIVNTRNYYTHLDKKLVHAALRGPELYKASRLLDALLKILILRQIGVKRDYLNQILKDLI